MSTKLLGLMILFLTQMIFAFGGGSGTAFVCRTLSDPACMSFRFIGYTVYENGMIKFERPAHTVVYSNHWIIKIIED